MYVCILSTSTYFPSIVSLQKPSFLRYRPAHVLDLKVSIRLYFGFGCGQDASAQISENRMTAPRTKTRLQNRKKPTSMFRKQRNVRP